MDAYLDTLGLEEEDLLQEQADVWVKSKDLEDVVDAKTVCEELRKGNIVLLNIEPLYKRNTIKLKQSISEVKSTVHEINGDIVRITEYLILVTPRGMKVSKKSKKK